MTGALIILIAFASIFFKRSFRRTALIAIAAGGFSTMAFQILLLLAFQIMYGYLFYKLGIILTAFMAGLALGAVFAVRAIEKLGKERYFLAAVQGDFILYSLILPVFFLKGGSSALFPVMSAIAGFIGGSQFPIAARALSGENENTGRAGGLTYGTDLFGSFFGAIFTGVLLVPILGIPKTCIALAAINTVVLALLVLNLRVEE
jgi:spermidine synthase